MHRDGIADLSLENYEEMRSHTASPLFVVSKMSKIRRASITVPTPRAYARAGLASIGHEVRVSPFWTHTIIWAIIASMPVALMDGIRIGMTTKIRKRALAKKNKKK